MLLLTFHEFFLHVFFFYYLGNICTMDDLSKGVAHSRRGWNGRAQDFIKPFRMDT